ncbi:hypothetical protein MtrunA17_Chr5g0400741 [Medicago truncatula]|uniref:Knr4/Smi1-like domain-containing protein n=1 Tax=Medicago truncatula TaxID=3880 RepID=G7K148_MEDTR|nr:uncharacterized protein LOC11424110 [Medicago truncatula]AES94474.1 hypothetical protein MTR_5g014810 [Medicago truncatula]RHN53887.1 hypothetical protein MtrunA17_Chr5g0400741 [Medicago truncatula]
MTTTTFITNKETKNDEKTKPPLRPKKRRICFSFTTYANDLIQNLKSSNIIIEQGLTESEFQHLESKFNLKFPPDLHAILQQGLPVSPGFPNWRSSSHQQLQILLNIPVSSILRRVKNNSFWHPSWGPIPKDKLTAAQRILDPAPQLVPIFRHCYIPMNPFVTGNPVFYVDHSGDVRLVGYDIVGFFRDGGFLDGVEEVDDPVWAAREARRIEVWTEVADGRGERGWKWWWDDRRGVVGRCMDGVLRRLREGGWKEEEIQEMMMMNEDEEGEKKHEKHVSVLGLELLRAGWSREDIVYSLGVDVGNSWLDLEFDC